MESKKILPDGSIEGETFSGENYKGGYPTPKYEQETYGRYYERVREFKEQGFNLGDLSWEHWAIYCLGSPHNENCKQNEIID